jgi:SmpA / OmlA family
MTRMTKSELRMTKAIRIANAGNTLEGRATCSTFGFRHSSVIRHLSFVISRGSRLLLVAVLAFAVSCTPGKRITKANVEEVEEGMSKKQVESILGQPTSISNEDLVIMKKTTYVYRQGKDSVTIVFKDDKVQSKESTLSN